MRKEEELREKREGELKIAWFKKSVKARYRRVGQKKLGYNGEKRYIYRLMA